MVRPSALTTLVIVAFAIILADVSVFGIAHIDTASYTDQIIALRHGVLSSPDQWAEYRAFKPLYAVVGVALPFLSPDTILLGVNALFLMGLGIAMYFFLLELGFLYAEALLGSVWVLTGYPALAFGFALGTDISGWFFELITMLVILIAVRTDSARMLVFASLLGFLGAASKETGVVGLFFGGVYVLLRLPWQGLAKTARQIALLSIPFLVLEGALLSAVHLSGLFTFFGWLGLNESLYHSVHTLKFFIGSEVTTFNILLVLLVLGIYALARERVQLDRERWLQLIALIIAALPIIAWPFFTDRILYSEFFAVIPLALYGARYLDSKTGSASGKRLLLYGLYAVPLLISVPLVLIGGHDGLYALLHRL